MKRFICVYLLVGIAVAGLPLFAGEAAGAVDATFDLRVREEILEGVIHRAPDSDRNWIRVRPRAGLRFDYEDLDFELRLCNEHRHHLHLSKIDFDWSEVILDRGFVRWRRDELTTITVGRQDIIWPGGFLMLEGHPLDGSRSMYHNAVRVQTDRGFGRIDFSVIRNPRYDSLVLVDDLERRICDMDESGIALRWARSGVSAAMIWKNDTDPDGLYADLRTVTGAFGFDGDLGCRTELNAELALQYQDFGYSGIIAAEDGWALAGHATFARGVGRRIDAEAGFFYYSGAGEDLRDFRTPWGRWPKWSDLYIYTLMAEGGDGRVHVAAWENVAAPHVTLRRALSERVRASLGASWLLAPAPDWRARGLLTKAEVRFDLGRGLDGHLLWEMFDAGPFHDEHGPSPMIDTVHFLRWQLSWTL